MIRARSPFTPDSFARTQALALDVTKTVMHYKGITSTYRNAADWAAFITQIFQGLQARYGVDETRSWMIEVRPTRGSASLQRAALGPPLHTSCHAPLPAVAGVERARREFVLPPLLLEGSGAA